MKNLLYLLLFLLTAGLSAQTITWREINPTSSSLDNADPNGASGGRVNKLATSSDGNTLYAASEWGGLFISTDAGANWSRLDGHVPVVMQDVAVSPANDNIVLATSSYDGRTTSLAGLNRSTDGGTTWNRPATFNPPAGFCANANAQTELTGYGIAFDPDNPNLVYAGTNCGLATSTDGGATWTFVDPTPADGADRIRDIVVHNGIVDVVGDDGHYRFDGTTWTTTTTPASALPVGLSSIAVSPDEDNVLFATVGTRIFQTVDAGQTWTNNITNPRAQGRIPFVKVNDRSGSSYDLWFGDVQLHRCSCTTPASSASTGARCPSNTWTGPFTRTAGGHDDMGDILFDPTVSVNACPIAMASDGGVYLNTLSDATCQSPAWQQPSRTVTSLWLYGMDGVNASPGEDLYLGLQDNGTFSTMTGTQNAPNWNNQDCCDGFDVAATNSRSLYSVCCFGGRANRLFLRNRNFAGGGEINTYPPGNLPGFDDGDLVLTDGGGTFIVATTNGVYFTTNIGANPIVWTPLGNSNLLANIDGLHLATAADGTITIYAQNGTANGRSGGNIRRFDGLSATGAWTNVNPPGGVGGFSIFDAHPNNPELLIAAHLRLGQTPAMVLSTDGGSTWNPLPTLDNMMTGNGDFLYTNNLGPGTSTTTNGYPQPSLVAFYPDDEDFIVAGANDAGVFISLDQGATWRLASDPNGVDAPHVPRPKYAHFEWDFTLSGSRIVRVYLGTKGRGVFRMQVRMPGGGNPCLANPIACFDLEMFPGRGEIFCNGNWPCYVRDPIPRNCFVKYRCPGCEEVALCPPYYNLLFEDFPFEFFTVDMFHPKDKELKYEVERMGEDLVISFRPTEEYYDKERIGEYELIFSAREKDERILKQRFKMGASIMASEKPFNGREDYKLLKELVKR